MKYSAVFLTSAVTLVSARTNIFDFDALLKARSNPSLIHKREVPQEHSHESIVRLCATALNLNNPDKIKDPVFGLLGDAAAAQGAGNIADPACLQTATADQAFTNAKAASNVDQMVAALTYRALERNTGSVGQASAACKSIKPKNPEIAALSQHQDPASDNAAAINKAITLELAKQIASVGGDPNDAIKSGTFAPGKIGDPTGAGNTCDDANDAVGCIFTQNLLVPDATPDEIAAAVGGSATQGSNGNVNSNNLASNQTSQDVSNAAVAASKSTIASNSNLQNDKNNDNNNKGNNNNNNGNNNHINGGSKGNKGKGNKKHSKGMGNGKGKGNSMNKGNNNQGMMGNKNSNQNQNNKNSSQNNNANNNANKNQNNGMMVNNDNRNKSNNSMMGDNQKKQNSGMMQNQNQNQNQSQKQNGMAQQQQRKQQQQQSKDQGGNMRSSEDQQERVVVKVSQATQILRGLGF